MRSSYQRYFFQNEEKLMHAFKKGHKHFQLLAEDFFRVSESQRFDKKTGKLWFIIL